MTAAALLVVLGAALSMQVGGLSMAMGAFLAGVLLSESSFRHQLEADIEPFRGILLGLFFLAVGMSLDLAVVAQSWRLVAFYVVALHAREGASAIYAVARLPAHRARGSARARRADGAGRRVRVRAVRRRGRGRDHHGRRERDPHGDRDPLDGADAVRDRRR